MGYTVLEDSNFEYNPRTESETEYNRKKTRSNDDKDHPIIQAFMSIIPDFETENELV